MFQKSSKEQPFYLQKKKLFHESIRKRDREIIIKRLRKKAQMPNHLQEMLMDLPRHIKQLIMQIVKLQLREWEQIIAQEIVNSMRLKQLFDLEELEASELISFFIFLLNKSNQEEQLYKQYYHYIQQKSQLWTYPNRIHLFAIFNFMLKKGHSFVLEDSEAFHATLNSNRFFQSQLYFYDIILRKYPIVHNLKAYLPYSTLKRLSEQVQSHFYTQQQRVKMIQVLIQILYVSEEQQISKSLDIPKLLTRLQYFIGYNNKNKLLLGRSIVLIYNINIDATSKSFVDHNCFKVITAEMRNTDHHLKIRLLLAELYLNSILNYPADTYYSFLKANISSILENYQYIVDEFNYDKAIHEFIVEMLTSILTHLDQQSKQDCPVMDSIRAQASLLNKLCAMEECESVLQKFKIVKI